MSAIRIQDDLYNYVNKEWLDQAVIPDDEPTTGGFALLNREVESLMIKELNEMLEKGEYPDELLKKACLLFKEFKDVKKRKRYGIKPALKYLAKLLKLKDLGAFNRALKDLYLKGYPLPFDIQVEVDMKDTLHHVVMMSGPSTILPDVTYYSEPMKQQKDMMIGLWSNVAMGVLAQTNLTPEEQQLFLADTLKFDAIIATLVKSSQEWSEYTNMYNPMKTSKVARLLKPVKFKKLLEKLYDEVPEKIIVADPRFLNGFASLFNEENFEAYKHWAYVTCLLASCSYLSEELRELGGTYRRALMGIQKMASPEKFGYNQVAFGVYAQPIGLYYGKKYFGEEAKKDVVDMVHEIIEQYKVRVLSNPILEEETKQKAILKLSTMEVKMGYPDKVQDYYYEIHFDTSKSLFDIMHELGEQRRLRNIADLKKDVDRTEWGMPGHMVNASYNPFNNDITFPAAILQVPFYSVNRSRSENLGGIGAVIGHEISHAFDNNGAKCDEHGNINNWWTKKDFKRFEKATKAMIEEFQGIELPWGKVNSELIVSENIADNGGMAVTLDLMKKEEKADYEAYFKTWAKVWCLKAKPEYLALLLNVDVHAPTILRANMQPRNFPEWYETFKVTKKDGMYIAPKKRVIIW